MCVSFGGRMGSFDCLLLLILGAALGQDIVTTTVEYTTTEEPGIYSALFRPILATS